MSWEIKMLNEFEKRTFFINCKFQFFTKIFLLSVLLNGHNAFFCSGSEPIQSLDFSGNVPIFLSKKQIREDLNQASRLFRDNYLRYPIFEHSGINWESCFPKAGEFLVERHKSCSNTSFSKAAYKNFGIYRRF